MGNWRQIAERVRDMDRAELRERLRQEFFKRQDALLGLLGFPFSRAETTQQAQPASFFFEQDSIASILSAIRGNVPNYRDSVLQQAERICQHRFDLLGYTDLCYGSPIDWHLDIVHNKRAPRKVFYRVRYLDFAQVGDSKITWELNRHQHFVTLAKAYHLTGDAKYVDEILREWRHWWTANPYLIGINWASSLEVAFRSLSWLWTQRLLDGLPGIPAFRREWLRGLALHGRHIERYLSTYFSPNTHLLGEGVALFFIGVLCPELPSASRWKQMGWKIVLEESRRQVHEDGFHFEHSTYYHVYALDFFLHSAVLASMNNIPVPTEFEQTIERMLNALCLLSRAGAPPRWGDDDGGRLFDPRRNRGEHQLDPLCTGAILFNRGDFKAAVGSLREETIWLLGTEGVKRRQQIEPKAAPSSSGALPDAGVYVLSAQESATQCTVYCGSLGSAHSGHSHADSLSIALASNGQDLLIDPGTCEYIGENNDRGLFRGTSMHNTLTVDGADQAEPAAAFSWRTQVCSKVETWMQARSFDFFEGSHDGYKRLPGSITHRRSVLSLKNGFYLVRDSIQGQGRHELQVSWNLSSEMHLVDDGLFRRKGASEGMALLPAAEHNWAMEVHRQASSPVYGKKSPITVLKFFKRAEAPSPFCCAMIALQEALVRPGTFHRTEHSRDPIVDAYKYVSDTQECLFYYAESGKKWECDLLSSDADLVIWIRSRNTAAQQIMLMNGTTAEIRNGLHLRFAKAVSWGELQLRGTQREVFSSDPQAVVAEPVLAPEITSASQPS